MSDFSTGRSGGGDLIAWRGVVLTAVHFRYSQDVEGTVLAPSSAPAPYSYDTIDTPHDE